MVNSVGYTEGSGKDIATFTINGKEHQAVVLTDESGNAALLTENNVLGVGNGMKKFRDGFASRAQGEGPDPLIWDEVWTNQGTSFAGRAGNAAGSSYLKISLDPAADGSEYILTSKDSYKLPIRLIMGVSNSQRIVGQELEMSLVGCEDDGVVETLTPISDIALPATLSVTTNIATIVFPAAHNLRGGDRVIIYGNNDSRLNVGPVVITVIDSTQITLPLTLANGTYNCTGSLRWADPFGYANNAVGFIRENATVTQATWATRRNGYNTRMVAGAIGTSTATQSNTSTFSDAFNAAGQEELYVNLQEAFYVSRGTDGLVAASGNLRWTQGLPDEEKSYKIRFRAKNLNCLSRPVAKIVSIAKTGTTTATVTTNVPHGLTTSSWVQIYGVRDQTNFPNLTAATAVASVPTSTTFTIVIGTASTTSSAGGCVYLVNAGVLAVTNGMNAVVAQNISRTNNILTVIGNTTWAGLLPGDTVSLYGCDATSMGLYDGAYRVLRITSTTLNLESVGGDFTTINCGGAVIKRTDYRIHFVSQLEHTRHVVELFNQHGSLDANRALPVAISSGNLSTLTTVTTVNNSWNPIPTIGADIASAAITTTATTAAIAPTGGSAYQINIPVTAVSGTNPTLDFSIEESHDTGTNWEKVYDFPRITATGFYRSPILKLKGNRIRYVQTVGGTTPSFTRAVNRLASNAVAETVVQLIDRTIVPNTLNSTTPSIRIDGTRDVNMIVRCTAQTTPATIAIQFSDNNSDWFTSSTTLTTAVGIVQAKATNEQWAFARLIVTAAGTGITLGEATLKAQGY